jgi:hypothetical protein
MNRNVLTITKLVTMISLVAGSAGIPAYAARSDGAALSSVSGLPSLKPGGAKINEKALVHKRVADWFQKYDSIRHAAQMRPAEKSNANRLVSAALSGNTEDKKVSRSLLSTMSQRYATAVRDLSALKFVPETAELQQQYLKYFKNGQQFFSTSLKQLNGKDGMNLLQMKEARQQMMMMDVENKLLDKGLRKKYDIAPYRWD